MISTGPPMMTVRMYAAEVVSPRPRIMEASMTNTRDRARLASGSLDHQAGELQTQTGLGDRADHDAGAGAGQGYLQASVRTPLKGLQHVPPAHAGLLLEPAHHEYGPYGPQARLHGRVAHAEDHDQEEGREQQMTPFPNDPAQVGQLLAGHAPEVTAEGLQVHHVEQRKVVEACGKDGGLAHLKVGNPQHVRHDEGPRAHHRRHDLASGGGHRLHCAGKLGAVTDLHHQGDGEGAGGDHIGNGRAADGPEKSAAHDRHLGRPTPEMPGHGVGEHHEKLTGAGDHQKPTEHDENEDETRAHAERDAEQPFGGQVLIAQKLFEVIGRMAPGAGDVVPGEVVEKGTGGDDHQRGTHQPSRALQDQQDARPSQPEIA